MVKSGQFTVELVDADQKVPYCEYAAMATNGTEQSLVFLDNGDEYYVRVKSEIKEKTMCSVIVDGQNLGYTVKLGGKSSDCGIWSFKAGCSMNRALKFEDHSSTSPTPSSHHQQGENFRCCWIDVEFYEAIQAGTEKRQDFLPRYAKEGSYREGQEVILKKKEGQTRKRHEKGKLLQRVSLGYCSVLEAPQLCYNESATNILQ
mmetsp:Transcript_10890/g.13102  ORF Transcript_10890/g.13102 Transcript_10890/m.13102 type:complete len:203 (-) Transcript_10890:99-707(-)|eukprot:CAMPEP_0195291290 /NCGR_PEP_ID=MMETSP0707-20130614/7577_1 /TAXON_ID=33640 /ORGANISM="Asterionellopsis glacialis, Strain CCMP134" /LENGTH=202 /DNA_ID=CAMNT_0040351585 /DNA_START=67 /DNA_END=675 /DNA_ORIENTATION=+